MRRKPISLSPDFSKSHTKLWKPRSSLSSVSASALAAGGTTTAVVATTATGSQPPPWQSVRLRLGPGPPRALTVLRAALPLPTVLAPAAASGNLSAEAAASTAAALSAFDNRSACKRRCTLSWPRRFCNSRRSASRAPARRRCQSSASFRSDLRCRSSSRRRCSWSRLTCRRKSCIFSSSGSPAKSRPPFLVRGPTRRRPRLRPEESSPANDGSVFDAPRDKSSSSSAMWAAQKHTLA
mmetsp:Transcript_99152/g.212470  ORF Transcript_99152/g.212470 Transcript_99152/m.212470 type:complete len:238 (-) Transcript_99152:78-791(-)